MIRKLFLLALPLLCAAPLFAQNMTGSIYGTVKDAETNAPIGDASLTLSGTGKVAASTANGYFSIASVAPGKYSLVVSQAGFLPVEQALTVRADKTTTVDIFLKRDQATSTNSGDIPTVTLDEAEAETEGAGEVANLLHASRDVFQTVAGFGWSFFRFRERGYDSEHFPVYLNGVSINDPESGTAFFGEFGGLNDVLRNRESAIGMEPTDYAFSEIGGATLLDTRASNQRKQIRASYAISNRTYNHRVMLTMNTGLMPGGWAVSVSGSRRWAQEGWYDGTFFDAYSYFLSVDKKFGLRHNLNLTILGAPSQRGRNGDTFQEMYDLAGTTRYNPNWGYWNGDKRNANVSYSHQPIGILRWDWAVSRSTSVLLSAYGQAGKRGDTRLDWFNANNPAPDYNRRLPSGLLDTLMGADWSEALRNNEAWRQIDWVNIYEGNAINQETIADANGIAGNNVSGKRSNVVVADYRSDSKEAGFNGVVRQSIGDRFMVNGGANFQWYTGKNFKTVDDILGGDFIVDWDRFAQRDFPNTPLVRDNDIRTPNRIVREGETYGYDYDENIRKAGAWVQLQGNFRRLSFFGAAENLLTTFWRTGNMQNGRYQDSSLGDSEKQTFNTYGLKAGVTYKVNGRNYVYANGFTGTRAPLFRDVFLSPRLRNQYGDGVRAYDVNSVEGGYLLRSPKFRARVTGYFTTFEGEQDAYIVYQPTTGVFGTILTTGINRQHAGVELALEAKPIVGWTATAAANIGQYIFTSRPKLYLTEDNSSDLILNNITVYQENFYVPRTPQTTALAGLKYEGKGFWFASLTLNWMDNLWYDFDRTRRTKGFVETIEKDSDLWNTVLDQKKAPAAFTLDIFGGKSFRIAEKYFIYLNVGVNNILDNRNVIISGRDAYRNAYRNDITDVRLYSNEITYAPGVNYFISITFRK